MFTVPVPPSGACVPPFTSLFPNIDVYFVSITIPKLFIFVDWFVNIFIDPPPDAPPFLPDVPPFFPFAVIIPLFSN